MTAERRSRLERWVERRLGRDAEFLIGDLVEERARRSARGRLRARAWFWVQLLRALASREPVPRPPVRREHAPASRWRGLSLDLAVFGRKLRRRPVWAAAVVSVLALGIGANAAMFAGFDAWVTRPLGFAEPDRLVDVAETRPREGVGGQPVSPRNLVEWRERQSSLAALEAFQRTAFNLADVAEPVRVQGARVSHALFETLGIAPVIGRPFGAGDDLPGQPATTALISHRLWHERFGADRRALGASIRLDGRAHEIVGVMPEGFRFPEWHDVWTPLGLEPRAGRRDDRRLSVVARLAPGRSIEQAGAELQAIAAEIERDSPETSEGWSVDVRPLRDVWVPPVIGIALIVSLAAGALVLIVVCANVAGLLLAEAAARSRETAIRSALGASRWRLARQTMLEGVLLASAAGAVAVGVCVVWIDWMRGRAPIDPPYLFEMRLDPRVLLYTVAVSLAAGAATSLAPVVRRSGRRLADELGAGTRATSVAAARLRGALVAAELALSTALLVGALLLVKSFHRQQSVDPGYRSDGLYTMQMSLTGPGFEIPALRAAFAGRLQDELAASSGIRNIGVSDGLPARGGTTVRVETPEHPAHPQQGEPGERTQRYAIGGRHLETLEVALVAGRPFTEPELREGGDVAIVSASLARALWRTHDAVGRSLRPVDDAGDTPWLRVVGVASDVRFPEDMVTWGALPVHQLYRPYASLPGESLDLVVESDFPAASVALTVRDAVRRTGLPVPVSELLTMRETIRRSQWVTRVFSEQLALYAAFALLIAAVGIYGLVADSVVQRRGEIAVRLALGARPRDVRREVVAGVARLGVVGLGAGLLLGTGVARLASAMLGGVRATDPGVLSAVVALLAATLLAASYGPARRASNADPARALRSE